MPPAPPALAFGFFLTPAGVAACSRWLSVVCDTTGTEILQFRTPAGVPASCKSRRWHPSRDPSRVRNLWRIFPVVSQKTLNHRLQAATPSGSNPDFLRVHLRFVHNTKLEKWAGYLQLSHSCGMVSFRKAKLHSQRSWRHIVAHSVSCGSGDKAPKPAKRAT
jgi:hypothetical protein